MGPGTFFSEERAWTVITAWSCSTTAPGFTGGPSSRDCSPSRDAWRAHYAPCWVMPRACAWPAARTPAFTRVVRWRASVCLPATRTRLVASLNALTPPGIAVTRIARALPGFDARRDAVSRTYRYFLQVGGVASPFCAATAGKWRPAWTWAPWGRSRPSSRAGMAHRLHPYRDRSCLLQSQGAVLPVAPLWPRPLRVDDRGRCLPPPHGADSGGHDGRDKCRRQVAGGPHPPPSGRTTRGGRHHRAGSRSLPLGHQIRATSTDRRGHYN